MNKDKDCIQNGGRDVQKKAGVAANPKEHVPKAVIARTRAIAAARTNKADSAAVKTVPKTTTGPSPTTA